jgi:GT2 family glycosyltransferase
MKFVQKYPDAQAEEQFNLEESVITKAKKLGNCKMCHAVTRFYDLTFQTYLCSEECMKVMWDGYDDHEKPKPSYHEERHKNIKIEMDFAEEAEDAWKDILIVVHNQLEYLKTCIESVQKTTTKYKLWIWDNASDGETQRYIDDLRNSYDPDEDDSWDIEVVTGGENIGFIKPNNEMAERGRHPYIILLNSDCKVYEGWDRALLGWLQKHEDVAETGYIGGLMDEVGKGDNGDHGYDVDFIAGWCLCMRRSDFDEFGLFSKQLKFAYCEDADLSLRIKEAGKKIYALHSPLVHHYGNKTIKAVHDKGEINVQASFDRNHQYLKKRWKDYLQNDRVLLKRPDPDLFNRPF